MENISLNPKIRKEIKKVPIAEASRVRGEDAYEVRWLKNELKKHKIPIPIEEEVEIITFNSVEAFDLKFVPYDGSPVNEGRLFAEATKRYCTECEMEPFYDQKKERYYCPNCQ